MLRYPTYEEKGEDRIDPGGMFVGVVADIDGLEAYKSVPQAQLPEEKLNPSNASEPNTSPEMRPPNTAPHSRYAGNTAVAEFVRDSLDADSND